MPTHVAGATNRMKAELQQLLLAQPIEIYH